MKSALEIALETNQVDLARLLLCNGFPPDPDGRSFLPTALGKRQQDFVELLLRWGADPSRVHPSDLLDTYDTDLYDRFTSLGMDLTRDHALARMLAHHSSNRPAYGWARRHNTDPDIVKELSIALLQAVVENRERAVALLVWAGADPRKPVPDLRYSRDDTVEEDDYWSTAMVHAVMYGHGHLLKVLKPHPSRDDFDMLWLHACDEHAISYLAKHATPDDWSPILARNLERTLSRYPGDHPRKCVEKLTLEYGARLSSMSADAISAFRRELLRCKDDARCRWVLRWMSYPETCDPAVFTEVTRTPSVRGKLNRLRIRDARYRE